MVETEVDDNHDHSPAEDEGVLWLAELGPEVGGGSMCVVVTELRWSAGDGAITEGAVPVSPCHSGVVPCLEPLTRLTQADLTFPISTTQLSSHPRH